MKFTFNQSFDISNTKFQLGLAKKHVWNIIEEIVSRYIIFYLFQ